MAGPLCSALHVSIYPSDFPNTIADSQCRYGTNLGKNAVTAIIIFRTLGGLSSAGGSVTLGMVADMVCISLPSMHDLLLIVNSGVLKSMIMLSPSSSSHQSAVRSLALLLAASYNFISLSLGIFGSNS
jgi:hypothetical protein